MPESHSPAVEQLLTQGRAELGLPPRPAPPSLPHSVKFTIDKYGVTAEFNCAAPLDAGCRRGCVIGCTASLEGYRCEHDFADIGRCLLVQWLVDSGETIESYAGEAHPVISGPVHLIWAPVSASVEWRYPS